MAKSGEGHVLIMTSGEFASLASLLYGIATGEHDLLLAPNVREALMQLYADAYWSGIRIDKRVKEGT